MRRKIEYLFGEGLVEILIKAHVHLLYLAKDYERESQELSVLRKSLQRW